MVRRRVAGDANRLDDPSFEPADPERPPRWPGRDRTVPRPDPRNRRGPSGAGGAPSAPQPAGGGTGSERTGRSRDAGHPFSGRGEPGPGRPLLCPRRRPGGRNPGLRPRGSALRSGPGPGRLAGRGGRGPARPARRRTGQRRPRAGVGRDLSQGGRRHRPGPVDRAAASRGLPVLRQRPCRRGSWRARGGPPVGRPVDAPDVVADDPVVAVESLPPLAERTRVPAAGCG